MFLLSNRSGLFSVPMAAARPSFDGIDIDVSNFSCASLAILECEMFNCFAQGFTVHGNRMMRG